MSPTKLRLKRTPAEQREHDLRKARKSARKAAKHTESSSDNREHKRRRRTREGDGDGDDEDHRNNAEHYSPESSPSGSHRAHKPDYDYIREAEEARFREKLWDALGDDERLDSVQASFNSYAHIPRRWRSGGMERMDDETRDPHFMDDDAYAEWVRLGMWRKQHAAEYEEQVRREDERKARAARAEAMREETRQVERDAQMERTRRRRERELKRERETREGYESRWRVLLAPSSSSTSSDEDVLGFDDIPWPVAAHANSSVHVEDLTVEAISGFLFPLASPDSGVDGGEAAKVRKEKLRETMLRFHPDKFEGRIMHRVLDTDRQRVKDAVGAVARTLNALLGQAK